MLNKALGFRDLGFAIGKNQPPKTNPQPRRNKERGQTLIIIILLLLMVGLMLPMGTFLGRHEAKQAVGEKKATVAFHVAEAGADRAQWKFDESQTNWTNCSTAGTLPDANFDGTYTFSDVAEGKYKVKVSSGPAAGNVTVWVVGQDNASGAVRGLKAIFSADTPGSAVEADGNIEVGGNFTVHWGAIKASNGNLDLSGTGAQRYYPRKYATGNLTGTGGFPRDTNSSTPPNTDNVEWWSHYTLSKANVDMADYETRAKNYISSVAVPGSHSASCLPGGTTGKGGYHPHDVDFSDYEGVMFSTGSGATFYITGNITIKNCYIMGEVVTTGNINFTGSGHGSEMLTIPPNAKKEYEHPDGLTVWNDNGWTNGGSYARSDISLNGFLYTSGNISSAGGNHNIYGVLMSDGNTDSMNGNVTVYYNDVTNSKIQFTNQKFLRKSWEEYQVSDWSSPNFP